MSITSELRASARATYRLLFRAAGSTFQGDDQVLNAFREKVRGEFRKGRAIVHADEYASRIQLGREVADVLRKNIVQGFKVDASRGEAGSETNTAETEGGIWRLKLTKDTELGSNDTIKRSRLSSGRASEGKQGCCQSSASTNSSPSEMKAMSGQTTSIVPNHPDEEGEETNNENETLESEGEEEDVAESEKPQNQQSPRKKINFSTLKRLSQARTQPTLNEDDLEESFVKGSGPGGQSINKTSNNVQLLHKPTGIQVSCQQTRSLQTNRVIARMKIIEKLDQILNPGLSREDMKRARQVERERRQKKKALKKKEKRAQKKAKSKLREDSE